MPKPINQFNLSVEAIELILSLLRTNLKFLERLEKIAAPRAVPEQILENRELTEGLLTYFAGEDPGKPLIEVLGGDTNGTEESAA